MELKDLLATKPEDLAAKQEQALRGHAAEKLRMIAKLIEDGDYKGVEKHLENSPAGDDHGCDNTFISFDELQLAGYQGYTTDIGDVIVKLQELQRMQKAKEYDNVE